MVKTAETYHVPVLLCESVNGLDINPNGIYVDITFGGGGHSKEILSHLSKEGHLYSFDQDADAEQNIYKLNSAGKKPENFTFVRSNFRYLANWLRYYGVEKIDGLLGDLGVSSHHFDDELRGFSFRFNAPLDMRMNKRAQKTACNYLKVSPNSSPAEVVQAVLITTKSEISGLTDLVNLRKDEGVTRAFNLMSLSNDRLEKLNELIPLFIKNYNQDYSLQIDKVSYCRIVEHGISKISEQALEILRPVSLLLSQAN